MKLRPCPFCGTEAVGLSCSDEEGYIFCDSCDAEGPFVSHKAASTETSRAKYAKEAWNRRAYDEYITALEAILATLDLDKYTRDSINRAIAGLRGE